MREWLLRLLGRPRPIVIEFDRTAIVHARPGDVLVFTSPVKWSPEILESMKEQFIPKLQREAPGVAVCINSPEWQATLVPADIRSTGAEQ